MGYDFHIRRVPPEGWKAWEDRTLPTSLRLEKAAADESGDWERIHGFHEKIRQLQEQAKATQGLLISSQEWRAAIAATPGCRIATDADFVMVNPRTGDKISLKSGPDSVAVADKDGQWHGAILFRRGTATFSGRAWEPDHPVAIVACRLAALLKAGIQGDEGEGYPLEPGAPSTSPPPGSR